MNWQAFHWIIEIIQRSISFVGILIILTGVVVALFQYLVYIFSGQIHTHGSNINNIRLGLGRTLILGLEFIVAADLIGTTTTPDYYAVGILAIIVIIRTVLSFSLNRELMGLKKE
jgi:uncharacterized membrane protein